MSWETPIAWTAYNATPVTRAIMNTQVKGNMDYLKTEVDKLPTVTQQTQADFTPDKIVDAVYQNTGGKIRSVAVSLSVLAAGYYYVYCDATDGATLIILESIQTAANHGEYANFKVPPNYYYQIKELSSGKLSVLRWTEWDEH